MPSSPALILLFSLLAPVGALAVFLVYVYIRYAPIVGRIFEEKPMFLPLRVPPLEHDGESVRFRTDDGLELGGTYLPARSETRQGILVFCHEYLSDRWSYRPYLDSYRDQGYDIFTFDFRNHGTSEVDASYKPLQWVTNHEVSDLRGALAYVRSRADFDPAGFCLFGVSRGGGTALVVAAKDPGVWGVVTDGAFPTRGTMHAYILRWAEIYVGSPFLWRHMPKFIFEFVGWSGRVVSMRNLGCQLPDVERAASQIAPRPWLMIHGAKDAYIGVDIAHGLFAEAGEPKEMWIVPKAKHNRCRELRPEEYAERVVTFLARFAPRRRIVGLASSSSREGTRVEELSSSGVF